MDFVCATPLQKKVSDCFWAASNCVINDDDTDACNAIANRMAEHKHNY